MKKTFSKKTTTTEKKGTTGTVDKKPLPAAKENSNSKKPLFGKKKK